MNKDYIKSIDCDLYVLSGKSEKTNKNYEFAKLEITLDNETFTLESKFNKQLFDYLLKKEAERE